MLGKRGMTIDVVRAIQDFIMAIALGALLFTYVGLQKDNSAQQATLIAEDVSQVLSALDSAPGSAFTTYRAPSGIDLSQFTGFLETSYVHVKDKKAPILATRHTTFSGALAGPVWSFSKHGFQVDSGNKLVASHAYKCPTRPYLYFTVKPSTEGSQPFAEELKKAVKQLSAEEQGDLLISIRTDGTWPSNSVAVYASDHAPLMANACWIFNSILEAKNLPELGAGGVFPVPVGYRPDIKHERVVVVEFINPTFMSDNAVKNAVLRSIAEGVNGGAS